jgi:hypothetical protein
MLEHVGKALRAAVWQLQARTRFEQLQAQTRLKSAPVRGRTE